MYYLSGKWTHVLLHASLKTTKPVVDFIKKLRS